MGKKFGETLILRHHPGCSRGRGDAAGTPFESLRSEFSNAHPLVAVVTILWVFVKFLCKTPKNSKMWRPRGMNWHISTLKILRNRTFGGLRCATRGRFLFVGAALESLSLMLLDAHFIVAATPPAQILWGSFEIFGNLTHFEAVILQNVKP